MNGGNVRIVIPEIVERSPLHLVAIRIQGKPEDLGGLVPKAWTELQSRLPEFNPTHPDRQYGFTRPDDHISSEGTMVTFLGVEAEGAPKGLVDGYFPAGRYARFTWNGSFEGAEFARFYPSMFVSLSNAGLVPNEDLGWLEVYEDATHDWSDKSMVENRLTVLFPLA